VFTVLAGNGMFFATAPPAVLSPAPFASEGWYCLTEATGPRPISAEVFKRVPESGSRPVAKTNEVSFELPVKSESFTRPALYRFCANWLVMFVTVPGALLLATNLNATTPTGENGDSTRPG
jgi:hypothetical protein